jgi:hypothetical protein
MTKLMENKQTAVEWLVEQIESNKIEIVYSDEIHSVRCLPSIVAQAKEMERDQIIDAHDAAYIAMNLAFRGFDRSLEYYEATYGS